MGHIYVIGTADTKGEELAFLAARIREAGGSPLVADVGTRAPTITPDIPAPAIRRDRRPRHRRHRHGRGARRLAPHATDLDAVVGIGGGGGTAIVTAAMRALPFGVPKLMVSTLASGDVGPYVGVSDITMMHPVADLAGLNRITRTVLAQAAAAITAMAAVRPATTTKPAVGLSMFGVTTPCVTRVADSLRATHDPLVFHATGTGGRALEMLADSGMLEGLIDATTTEIADEHRRRRPLRRPRPARRLARTGLPWVGAPGAVDMVNFWAPETIPDRFSGRHFHRHNANVTLMRTTPEECRAIAAFIAEKLNAAPGPIRLLIPERGVSALDAARRRLPRPGRQRRPLRHPRSRRSAPPPTAR